MGIERIEEFKPLDNYECYYCGGAALVRSGDTPAGWIQNAATTQETLTGNLTGEWCCHHCRQIYLKVLDNGRD